jgi:hypothetical protein
MASQMPESWGGEVEPLGPGRLATLSTEGRWRRADGQQVLGKASSCLVAGFIIPE